MADEAVSKTLQCGYLQPVVMAVRAGGKLRRRAESRIGRLRKRKRQKTPIADCLMVVHLRQIRLVHCACADVLRADTSRGAQLMFQTKTPLQEVWGVKFSVGYRRDGHRRKTSCWICLCRCAGKLAQCKSRAKRLIGGHSCVYRAVR